MTRGVKRATRAQVRKGSIFFAERMNCHIMATPQSEEDAVEHARAGDAEPEQVGDGPASGESRAEHLGADQDRGADHGHRVQPVDPGDAGRRGGRVFCHEINASVGVRRGNLSETGRSIKSGFGCRKSPMSGQITASAFPSGSAMNHPAPLDDRRKPAAGGLVVAPLRDPALRADPAGAFRAGLRGGAGGA